MPRLVYYYQDEKGVTRNARSGAKLNNLISTPRVTYLKYDPNVESQFNAFNEAKATRKANAQANAKVNKALYTALSQSSLGNDYGMAARSRPKGIGSNRDSVISAYNQSYAKDLGLPLNAQNRALLKKIYADEQKAAIGAAQQDFEKYTYDFAAKGSKRNQRDNYPRYYAAPQ